MSDDIYISILLMDLPDDWDGRHLHHLVGILKEFVWHFANQHNRWPTQEELLRERAIIVKHLQENM